MYITEPLRGSPGPPREIKGPLFCTLRNAPKKKFDDNYDQDVGDGDEHEYKGEDGMKMKIQLNIWMKM